jgi:ribosome maturation factor RimP
MIGAAACGRAPRTEEWVFPLFVFFLPSHMGKEGAGCGILGNGRSGSRVRGLESRRRRSLPGDRRASLGPGVRVRGGPWVREAGHLALRVLADSAEGIGLEQCERIARALSPLLDERESLMPERYTLEVSSPGPDRPLRKETDYVRFQGHWANLLVAGRKAPLRGRLEGVVEGRLRLVNAEGTEMEFPLSAIRSGRLTEPPAGPPRRGERGRRSPRGGGEGGASGSGRDEGAGKGEGSVRGHAAE